MSVAVIDVREWQTTVDFATGDLIEADEHHLVKLAKEIIAKRYYPGDVDNRSINWVTDTALDLAEAYQPDFLFLSYAQPHFYSLYQRFDPGKWEEICTTIFAEITRLVDLTGFTPVVVGLGDMVPLKERIDLTGLDGLGVATNWSFHYAGLYSPSQADLEQLNSDPRIERVVSKERFSELFDGSQEFLRRFPDYLLVAREGYTFRGLASGMREISRIPAKNYQIPIYTPLGNVQRLVDIHALLDQALPQRKVALILIEGIGQRDFRLPYQLIDNTEHWYIYENSRDHYLTITTGLHFQYGQFPPGHLDHAKGPKYPYSGGFTALPQNTLGRKKGIKSAAVGTRNMITHVAAGADICIECFARQLYNLGTIAIINDPKYFEGRDSPLKLAPA